MPEFLPNLKKRDTDDEQSANPSVVPLSESSDPLIKDKKKRKMRKGLRFIFALILFIGLVSLLTYNKENLNGDNLSELFGLQTEPVTYKDNANNPVQVEGGSFSIDDRDRELQDKENAINEGIGDKPVTEFEGFGDVNILVSETDPAELAADNQEPEPVVIEEPIKEFKSNNNPDIDINGPEIEEKTNFNSYTYSIDFSDLGMEKYKDGVKYYIDPVDCIYDNFIVSDQKFEGAISDIEEESYPIEIFILEQFLDNDFSDATKSTYELTDFDGELITEGVIDVPACKRADEKNRFGEFSIEDPLIDTTVLQGVHHFTYYFLYDDEAKSTLSKGFSYNVEAEPCRGAGMNAEDYFFKGDFPPGEINTIGFSVNIKSDSIPDLEEDLYSTSRYTISDSEGTEMFTGYVDIPNCLY